MQAFRKLFEYRSVGNDIFVDFLLITDFQVIELDLVYISFILPMHESTSGPIASKRCNSWKVKLVF